MPGASARARRGRTRRTAKATSRRTVMSILRWRGIISHVSLLPDTIYLRTLTVRSHDGPLQLRHQRDHGQDRLLRAGTLRQDDEPAVRLRLAAVEQQEQDALAGDEDGPHALLRLPPAGPRQDPRDAHEAAAVHGAGAGLLQLDAPAGAEGR